MDTTTDSLWEQLDAVQRRLAEQLPEHDVTDAELSKALIGAATYGYLQAVCTDPDHPAFVPGPGFHLHTGTPNPDTVYLNAAVDGSGVYRITGSPGTVPDLTLMPMGPPTAGGVRTYPAFDVAGLAPDDDGSIDVVLSAERPPVHQGAWWELAPDVTTLMLRSVSDDWGRHREPALAITRLDGPGRRQRQDDGRLADRLALVALVAGGAIAHGFRKVATLRADGVVNEVALVDYSANGGLAGQWYHEGVYDLRRGEVLLLEAVLGTTPPYFSLSLTDGMFCTLDWVNAQSSLNRTQAVLDEDGVLRAVVAAEDPGVANWLDTTGHRVGVLQLRWAGMAAAPTVSVRAIPLDRARAQLTAGTATVSVEQRAAVLAERARRAQLRALW